MARKKNRRGGRTTPKGTGPDHLRPVPDLPPPDEEADVIDDIIEAGASDISAEGDPLGAEAWGSHTMAMFESTRRSALSEGLDVPPFEEMVLERCALRRDRPGLLVAAALASVVPPPLDERARSIVRKLETSVRGPDWLPATGQATATRAWVASDVFGDQESVIIGFDQPGHGSHAIVSLVDHNLSGQVKDAWLSPDVDVIVEAWSSTDEPLMSMSEVPVDEALDRLAVAMRAVKQRPDDTDDRTDDFTEARALISARLRRTGRAACAPERHRMTEDERESLVGDFLQSPAGAAALIEIDDDVDVALLARAVVDLRADHDGQPLRWSPIVVEELLTDLAPRMLFLDEMQTEAFPEVVAAFVDFATTRTGLDDEVVDQIFDAIDLATRPAGPAEAVLAALEAQGVDLADEDALREALDDLVGTDLGELGIDDPFFPLLPSPAPPLETRTETSDAPADAVESATGSVVLERFEILADFYGDGRKLTQTGNPTLADARELVDALGTDDVMDPTIDDRTFKTRSAGQLLDLSFTIRWAIAAGVLRKQHGKLLATTTWRKLSSKPMERWRKAADALVELGPLSGYHADNQYRDPDPFVDEELPQILRLLRTGPFPFDAALDIVCDAADASFQWLMPYMQDEESRRRSFGWDLDTLTWLLGVAGIVDRVGASFEPDPHSLIDEGTIAVGGTLELTPAGRWWLGG